MEREIKISSGAWQKDLEMTLCVLDEEKFSLQCKEINDFFCDSEYRVSVHGDERKAGLALFAQECFQQMAFNNFKDAAWLERQFDWGADQGIEGFPSFADMGVKVKAIEPWFIDSDEIEINEG